MLLMQIFSIVSDNLSENINNTELLNENIVRISWPSAMLKSCILQMQVFFLKYMYVRQFIGTSCQKSYLFMNFCCQEDFA